MDEDVEDSFAELRASTKAFLERHAGARPANPDLPRMGSYAEDFPEQHRKNGEPRDDRDGYTAQADVRVIFDDGTERVEAWRGISERHAVGRARSHYRDVARADFASGEPW